MEKEEGGNEEGTTQLDVEGQGGRRGGWISIADEDYTPT